jgi:hypothetical protein
MKKVSFLQRVEQHLLDATEPHEKPGHRDAVLRDDKVVAKLRAHDSQVSKPSPSMLTGH